MNKDNTDEYPINFSIFKTHYANQVFEYLKTISGRKAIVFEEDLLMSFSYILGGIPKELEIEEKTILKSDAVSILDSPNIIFIVRPLLPNIFKIIPQIKEFRETKKFDILFIPRKSILCEEILEQSGIITDVRLSQITVDLIPLAQDVLSLEHSDSFANLLLQGDTSFQIYVKNAIQRLETIFGSIPYKYAKGNISKKILSDLATEKTENQSNYNNQNESEIDGLIMMDRTVDLMTPFCIQRTYEGILDETFGIETCSLKVKARILAQDDEEKLAKMGDEDQDIKMWLIGEEDSTFKEIRDANFASLNSILPKKVMEFEKIRQDKDSQTIEALSEYIKKLKDLKIIKEKEKLGFHVNISHYLKGIVIGMDYKDSEKLEQQVIEGEAVQTIFDTIELQLGKEYDKNKVLRILCLLSLRDNGYKKKHYDFIIREYLQSYGFNEIFTLLNLETAGLMKRGGEKNNWQAIKKAFRLINAGVNIEQPNDISYAYNGYAPISMRLIELIASSRGWNSAFESLRLLNGEVEIPSNEFEFLKKPEGGKKKIILVFMVGGITFAEISCIRFLNRIYQDYLFVVATTEIINGNVILDQMREKEPNLLNIQGLLPKKK